jgi:hypothetical protein
MKSSELIRLYRRNYPDEKLTSESLNSVIYHMIYCMKNSNGSSNKDVVKEAIKSLIYTAYNRSDITLGESEDLISLSDKEIDAIYDDICCFTCCYMLM